jgi:hypothetical protein
LGAKPRVAFHLRGKEKGRGNDVGPLVNGSSQTVAPFQFSFMVLLQHGRGAIFNLQHSTLVAANFNPRRH